ncbi:unnamed protein product, partial [Symbiodinium sp. CCMP2456]
SFQSRWCEPERDKTHSVRTDCKTTSMSARGEMRLLSPQLLAGADLPDRRDPSKRSLMESSLPERSRLKLKPPSQETLARRQRELEESDRMRLLPAQLWQSWSVTNSGTYGVIFTDGSHALKVSIRGVDPSMEQSCERQVTEAVVYSLASELGTQVPRKAQLLERWGTGSLRGTDDCLRSHLVLDLLQPDVQLPGENLGKLLGRFDIVSFRYCFKWIQHLSILLVAVGGFLKGQPRKLLLSVQLGQTDLGVSAGSFIEGPAALVGGQNKSQGWRNMNGAVFAKTVGREVAGEALQDAGFLHGYLETFGLFLHDSEMIWGTVGSGRACLYVLDFDKAILDCNPDDIERLRCSDPVFPRPSQRTIMADYWGAVFWRGWSAGKRAAQSVLDRSRMPFGPQRVSHRFKQHFLTSLRQKCTVGAGADKVYVRIGTSVSAEPYAICTAESANDGGCVVSWDDVCRSHGPADALSSGGPNITDARLKARSGQALYTVRSCNWNERLGKVSADDIFVLVPGQEELAPVSLREYLKNIGEYGGYAGLAPDTDLSDLEADDAVSIRFQTTFLPVLEDGSMEFCAEAFNYQTRSEEDPKNLVLLCTSQGAALQQQGVGNQRLFLHDVQADGRISRRWLEAQRTGHRVGGSQEESSEAAAAAAEVAAAAAEAAAEAREAAEAFQDGAESAEAEAALRAAAEAQEASRQAAQEAAERTARAAEAEHAASEGK